MTDEQKQKIKIAETLVEINKQFVILLKEMQDLKISMDILIEMRRMTKYYRQLTNHIMDFLRKD